MYMQYFCIEVGCLFLFKDCRKVNRMRHIGLPPSYIIKKVIKSLSSFAQIVFF